MARTRTKPAVKQAQGLLDWLETLDLPARVINALRRDLEAVMGQREGSGVLAGLDQAGFTEELYRTGSGRVGQVSSVAKAAIEALRAAISAPGTGDSSETVPAEAAPELAPEAAPAEVAPAEAAPEPAPEPTPVEAASAEDAPKPETALVELSLATAGAPPTEASEAPAPRRGRGRPRKSEAVPAEAPATPERRRGRPRRTEATPAQPAAISPAEQRVAQLPVAPAEAPARAPAGPTVADPSFDAVLRLWRELHPQGRRAAMHYMAGLVSEGGTGDH